MRDNISKAIQILDDEIQNCLKEMARIKEFLNNPTPYADIDKLKSEDLFFRGRLELALIIKHTLKS